MDLEKRRDLLHKRETNKENKSIQERHHPKVHDFDWWPIYKMVTHVQDPQSQKIMLSGTNMCLQTPPINFDLESFFFRL